MLKNQTGLSLSRHVEHVMGSAARPSWLPASIRPYASVLHLTLTEQKYFSK